MTLTGEVHVFSALSMIDTATHLTAFVRIANNTELNVTLSLLITCWQLYLCNLQDGSPRFQTWSQDLWTISH